MSGESRRSRSLTDRGRALLAAGLTLVASGVGLGFVDLTRIGLLAGVLPLLALAAARLTRPRLDVQRTLRPTPLTVGSMSEVVLRLRNPTARPSQPALGEDRLSGGLGGSARFVVPALAPGDAGEARYAVRPTRRGRQAVGPLQVRCVDPFGLTTSTEALTGSDEVVVLPPVSELAGRPAGAGGALGEVSTPRLVGVRGEADAAIREYRRGDDLRRIHWPVTAHRGTLMVRQEAHPALRRAVLLLDPARVADVVGEEPQAAEALLDWAVAALASVAAHLAGHGFALHVLTPQTGEEVADLPVDVADAVRTLAVVEPGRVVGPGAVEDPLLTLARELASGGGLLVTAVTAAGGERPREVLGIRPPGTPGVVFVLDPGSFGATSVAAAPGGRGQAAGVGLAALAAAGGWHATVVGGWTSVADAWSDVVGETVVTP